MNAVLVSAAILSLVLPIVYILCAPQGYEDDTGFHYGRPPSVMRVEDGTAYICAWCDTDSAGTEWAERRNLMASHGICPDCHARYFPKHPNS